MKYCTNCGKQLADDSLFCSKCGADLSAARQSSNQQAQPENNKTYNTNSTSDFTNDFDPHDIQLNKNVSILAYISILFFVPLIAAPNSKFARFHANQGLLLLLTSVALSFFNKIISIFIGFTLSPFSTNPFKIFNTGLVGSTIIILFNLAVTAIILTLMIIGIVNAYNGKAKELPVIGKFRLI